MISCGPSGSWNARTARVALDRRVGGRGCAARRGKRSSTASLHCDVGGRRRRAARRSRGKVVDPGEGAGVELALRGEALERAELCEPLGAQRRGDPRVELAPASSGLLAQPLDDRLLSEPVTSRSLSSSTGTTTWRFRRAAGARTVALSAAGTKQRRRRCQCRRLLAAIAAETRVRKRAPEAVLLESPEHAQLGDQLLRVVEHRCAGTGRAAASRPAAPAASRRTAWVRLACGFLDVVGLVDDERGRGPRRGELLAVAPARARS